MHYHSKTNYYFIDKFDRENINKINNHTALIFRNYINKNSDQTHLLMIKKYCKQKGIKFYLSNNVKLAIKLDLDGAYIPSFNKNFDHLNFSLKKKFKIIGSAHNIKEIKLKETQKVQKIFLSSLFKKNKNYLGINRFKILKSLTRKEIIALGGISKKNIRKLKLTNCSSFAGISFFK